MINPINPINPQKEKPSGLRGQGRRRHGPRVGGQARDRRAAQPCPLPRRANRVNRVNGVDRVGRVGRVNRFDRVNRVNGFNRIIRLLHRFRNNNNNKKCNPEIGVFVGKRHVFG